MLLMLLDSSGQSGQLSTGHFEYSFWPGLFCYFSFIPHSFLDGRPIALLYLYMEVVKIAPAQIQRRKIKGDRKRKKNRRNRKKRKGGFSTVCTESMAGVNTKLPLES